MNRSVNHEEALVNAFIDPHKRELYLEFVKKPKKGDKFLNELGHFKHLDPKYVFSIPPSHGSLFGTMTLLKTIRCGR